MTFQYVRFLSRTVIDKMRDGRLPKLLQSDNNLLHLRVF